MLIGVCSDTHNDAKGIKEVIDFFALRNADLILHCGDICLPEYANLFSSLKKGFKAVYGNNDFYYSDLEKVISKFGTIDREPLSFRVKNKSFIMAHRPGALDSQKLPQYDFALYGHTHRKKIEKAGKTILINPGEVCGWRYGIRTAALINLDDNRVGIFDLEKQKEIDFLT
ncbi:MAG: metallophosphoesterase [Elusimicrobiota bacterium]|jgi:putative phosphoesterase|nr:metallophosphoesterase [Elusimicrobiota bacterium]